MSDSHHNPQRVPSTAVDRPLLEKGFRVFVHGVLEGAECAEADSLFARTQLFFGPDWSILRALSPKAPLGECSENTIVYPPSDSNTEVITQLAECAKSPYAYFVWSTPFEFALQSKNAHGWPQLVVTLHVINNKPLRTVSDRVCGNHLECGDAIIGYSRCFVPMRSGNFTRKLSIMQLENATSKHQLISLLTREPPVLRDLSYICRGDDRVLLTTRPVSGHVKLSFVVMVEGMGSCGFDNI